MPYNRANDKYFLKYAIFCVFAIDKSKIKVYNEQNEDRGAAFISSGIYAWECVCRERKRRRSARRLSRGACAGTR